jgi:hypothetical protein
VIWRGRGIVEDDPISEREALVKASYQDDIEPASEPCMKGAVIAPRNTT